MTDVAAWLRGLDLGQYEAAFRDNGVDSSVLPEVTAEDLKDMGVAAVGHRRKLLAAIAALRGPPSAAPAAEPHPGATLPGDAWAGYDMDGYGAERRQLTVLFCDLAGSTALSARLDPEDLREVMAAYHHAVSDAIRAQGGYVAKLLGDGVLAYFGWPEAHEDDAERAVGAGLAAAAAVAGLQTSAGPLSARVGIATGPVVVGEVLGEGETRERGVVGETPNLAARLQGKAKPGAVVLDEATRRLAGALFEWTDLGTAELKGFRHPVRAWRAVCESQVESRFEALRSGAAPPPLVGREEELELLLRRWDQALTGEGQVVLLGGEAGIGKSRLAAALREALSREPHEEIVWYCAPHHADSPLHPVISRLERAAGFARGDAAAERLAKLEALLAPGGSSPEEVALIAELLGVPAGGSLPVLGLTPRQRRRQTLDALLRQLETRSQSRPTLALLEDAHWADPTTRELLDLLVARIPELPVLLVVTHRPEFAPPWTGEAHVAELRLGRLRRRDNAALAALVAGGKALPAEVLERIVGRTDGVPLFVEELTRAVLESGVLREEADRWVLDGPLAPLAVPATLQASLLARLDRLAPVREVAQIGAAIGREFSHELLAAATRMPEDRLRDALGQLVDAALVRVRGSPPEAVYSFKHALVQDVAYGTLLRGRRQEIHARIARALEEQFPEVAETRPELLAHHLAAAGSNERAVHQWRRAGRFAVERAAMAEAVAHFTAGLQALAGLPGGAKRDLRELDLQVELGGALIAAKGWAAPQTGQAYGRARELCGRLGETKRLIPVLFGLAVYYVNRAEPETGRAAAEEILRLALAQDDAAAELRAHRILGYASFKLGRLAPARGHLERVLALFDPARHRVLGTEYSVDTRIAGLSWLANTLIVLGFPDQALARGGEALTEARGLRHIQSLAVALTAGGCSLHCLARNPQALSVQAEELVALCARQEEIPFHLTLGQLFRGWALTAAEGAAAVEEGIALMQEALTAYRATGAGTGVSHYLGLLAEAHRKAGLSERGLDLLDQGLALVDRTGERWCEAELHRLRGELLLALRGRDAVAEVEPCFRRSMMVARSQGARWWELRAAIGLTQLLCDQGRAAEGRALLAPVYAAFTEGFALPDLIEAQTLLEELGAPPANGADRPREEARTPRGPDRLREPAPDR